MLKIVSVNLAYSNSLKKRFADLKRVVRARPDVILFQETPISKSTGYRVYLRSKGYDFWRPKGVGAAALPVAYRRDKFTRDRTGTYFLTPRTKVRKRGAGPKTMKAKRAAWIVLARRDDPKHLDAFVNNHFTPSIHFPERSALHVRQVARTAECIKMIRRYYPGIHLYVGGDFNTTDRKRLRPITRLGVRWGRALATHRKRAIDYVGGDTPLAGRRTIEINSDHRALFARFRD